MTDTARNPAIAHPHVTVIDRRGSHATRVTYAYTTDGTTVRYAAAFTAPGDNFSRKIGRVRAAGRLASADHVVIENVDTSKGETINAAIRADISVNNKPARWDGIVWAPR